MNERAPRVALDIGSTSVKAAAVDADGTLLASLYRPIRGRLRSCLQSVIGELSERTSDGDFPISAVTGSNAGSVARDLGVDEVNELIAAHLGATQLVPEAGAALELGGEHSTLLRFDDMGLDGERDLRDFAINSVCSAGTGAFLEQEAHRLNLTIQEFSEEAFRATRAVRIAGRCAVFAKTDVVHLHQNGVPLDGIAYSLCLAIARNIAAELVGGRPFDAPVALIGGVAANLGIRRALREVLRLEEDQLIVPEHHCFAAAIGTVLAARKSSSSQYCLLEEAADRLAANLAIGDGLDANRLLPIACSAALPPLRPSEGRRVPRMDAGHLERHTDLNGSPLEKPAESRPSVGIDIGSTTTNVVLLSQGGRVIDSATRPTSGRALTAVRLCLEDLDARLGFLDPRAVGVTGSGRKFIAEIVGADFVVNEITAHAAGGQHCFPGVETIFDIGGQDSKFIQLVGGEVTDFEMNKVCAAGTGSFIEEMSELLGLNIMDEFAAEAFQSSSPAELGERCTVFMSSELVKRLREGGSRADLAAGLCHSIVHNYLARVVGPRHVGDHVVFQGGVASNPAVVAALRQITGKNVQIHPHNELAGAMGVALLARSRANGPSRFRGLDDLDESQIQSKWFECHRCANLCEIHVTSNGTGRRFFSGGLCDRYEGQTDASSTTDERETTDLLAEREAALGRWIHPSHSTDDSLIGIPRALVFHEMLPFWSAFFANLEINHKFSGPTTRATLEKGAALAHANTCLPLKIAYGHCAELIAAGVKRLFIPSVANLAFRTVSERLDHLCPTVQGWPYTARALFPERIDFVTPRLRFSIPHLIERDLIDLGRSLGVGRGRARDAFAAGMEAQHEFQQQMLDRGREILTDRDPDKTYAALLSRSYTACDPQVYMRLKRVLDELDIVAVPMDMMPDKPLDSEELNGMYWYFGKRLLQVARELSRSRDLAVIFLSSFGCGPDSFIVHMLRRELAGIRTLELEVDEHSEFTGIHTRIEAFKYSLNGSRSLPAASGHARHLAEGPGKPTRPPPDVSRADLTERPLLIPRMSVHAFAFSGAFRSCGIDAHVLPEPDGESIAMGKFSVGGGECVPCAFLMGDMLRHLRDLGPNEPPPAFFIIAGDGPCRLGQYPWLHRALLNERGYEDVTIFNASQDPRFYERLGVIPAAFTRRVWRGTVAADVIFRKWRECRSHAADRSATDQIYRETVAELEACLAANGNVRRIVRLACDRLEAVPGNFRRPHVTIAVLGENYIRCNATANDRLAEALEDLGADVWFPSLCEWVFYTNWTARLHCRYERETVRLAKLHIIDVLQRLDQWRIERVAAGRLRNRRRPSLPKMFRLAAPYVPTTFEGETIVGIGRTIDLAERGVGGVIHVAPFGCMVGGIVHTLCERLSEDLGGFPILNLQYDGRHSELTQSKLEGFVHRAAKWQTRAN